MVRFCVQYLKKIIKRVKTGEKAKTLWVWMEDDQPE